MKTALTIRAAATGDHSNVKLTTTRVSRQFERNHPTTAAAESAPGNGTENFQSHHRAIDKVKKNYSAKHFLLNLLR